MAEEEKKPKITIKGSEITEQDYRGVIAIIFSGGAVAASIISVAQGRLDVFTGVMAVLGPLVTMIVKDYFGSRK